MPAASLQRLVGKVPAHYIDRGLTAGQETPVLKITPILCLAGYPLASKALTKLSGIRFFIMAVSRFTALCKLGQTGQKRLAAICQLAKRANETGELSRQDCLVVPALSGVFDIDETDKLWDKIEDDGEDTAVAATLVKLAETISKSKSTAVTKALAGDVETVRQRLYQFSTLGKLEADEASEAENEASEAENETDE